MARRPRRRGNEARLPAVYEGPEVLSALLARAGCKLSAEDVAERFRRAQREGEERSEAIPSLFQAEPRFAEPDEARRLYGNLFGLWAEVQAAVSGGKQKAANEPTDGNPADLPERGGVRGSEVPPGHVEAVWKRVAELPEREARRLRDRFEHAQPDLVSWLDAQPLPESGGLAAQDLAFDLWCMYDVAFGDRLRAATFGEVRALEAEPPPLESSQPAIATYAAEALDLVAEDDPGFGPSDRAQVERVVATVAAALKEAVEEEPEEEDG